MKPTIYAWAIVVGLCIHGTASGSEALTSMSQDSSKGLADTLVSVDLKQGIPDGFHYFDSPGIAPASVKKLRVRPADYAQFDARIGQYANITELEMDSILLVKIPLKLSKMKKLERIRITRCRVNEVPEWLGSLENLRVLDLSDNEIRKLPKEFYWLRNLESLDLENNFISGLSEDAGKLEKLQKLDIRNNFLTTVPLSLAKLKQLVSIELWDNCISAEEMRTLKRTFTGSNLQVGVQNPGKCR